MPTRLRPLTDRAHLPLPCGSGQLREIRASTARLTPGLDSVPGSRVDDGVMRTSELADQAGVNTETLRYYERRGLLTEPPRTRGGYRDYHTATVELLRFI